MITEVVRPLEMKIEAKSQADQERLILALQQFASFDPSFAFTIDAESGEVILKGLSEVYLDYKIEYLKRDYGIAVNTAAPQVAYRETVMRRSEIKYTHRNRSGGRTELQFRVEPRPRNAGNLFEHDFEDMPEVREFLHAIDQGVQSVLGNGLLIGCPMMDVGVELLAGDTGPGTNAERETATRIALKEACQSAQLALLEPIMNVEIETPSGHVGAVITDLDGRRGKILNQKTRGAATVLTAHVPLATMFGHAVELRRLTREQATSNMHYDRYDFVPRNISGGPDDFPPAVGMRA